MRFYQSNMVHNIQIKNNFSDFSTKRYIISANVDGIYKEYKLSINESREVLKMTSREFENYANDLFKSDDKDIEIYESTEEKIAFNLSDDDIDFINKLNSDTYDKIKDTFNDDVDYEVYENVDIKKKIEKNNSLLEDIDDLKIEDLCETLIDKLKDAEKYKKLKRKDDFETALTEAEAIEQVINEEIKDLKVWNVTITKNKRQMIVKIRATSEQEAIRKMRRMWHNATLVNVRLDQKMKKTKEDDK